MSSVDDVWPVPRVRGVRELESSVRAQLRAISDLETQICALQAEQVRRGAAYVREQLEVDSRLSRTAGEDQHRALVAEIALARRVSTLSASSWLADAFTLDDTCPATLAALGRGEVSLWAARQIGSQVSLLDDLALRHLADELIAAEAPGLTPGEVKKLARTRVVDVDPAAADVRAAAARAERYVTAAAGDDADGYLTAKLPAEQVLACWNAVHDHATAVYAGGDPEGRSVSRIMCDTLVERLTGISQPGKIKTHVNLVMTDRTLIGLDDKPGQLIGFGPIPPDTARLIAASGDTWLRRLYTDPVDGSAAFSDTRARRFKGAVHDLIVLRDQRCRAPRCPTGIADVDHIREHAKGGRTNTRNGQGLSKGCHTLRDHPGVSVTGHSQSNAVTWTLPSGASATTLPPPALGHGSGEADQVHRRRRLTQHGPEAPYCDETEGDDQCAPGRQSRDRDGP